MARNGKNIFISHHGSGRKVASKEKLQPNGSDNRYIRRDDNAGRFSESGGGSVAQAANSIVRTSAVIGSGEGRMTIKTMKMLPIIYLTEAEKEGSW